MADIAGTPLESFAAGMFSGRVESERRESADATYYQLVSVDSGSAGAGATITSGQNSQALGYQIQAALTWFTTVTPAVTGNGNTPTAACVLPQTNRPYPFSGLQIVIANYGANPINCFAHPNDAGNSINGLGLNVPVVLGPNTVTPFQCITPGVWNAVDIGGGFNGSIETVVSQGTITAAGTSSQANSTPITQQMAQVSAGATTNGVRLPPAIAGTQVVVNGVGGGAVSFLVFPATGDQINGAGANASFTFTPNPTTTNPTVFYCFVNGSWQSK